MRSRSDAVDTGEAHQDDRHQHRQQDQQLVTPEQPEFLHRLGQDFLHSGISDLRDSMSEIKTSSSENGTGFLSVRTWTPASSSSGRCLAFLLVIFRDEVQAVAKQ